LNATKVQKISTVSNFVKIILLKILFIIKTLLLLRHEKILYKNNFTEENNEN